MLDIGQLIIGVKRGARPRNEVQGDGGSSGHVNGVGRVEALIEQEIGRIVIDFVGRINTICVDHVGQEETFCGERVLKCCLIGFRVICPVKRGVVNAVVGVIKSDMRKVIEIEIGLEGSVPGRDLSRLQEIDQVRVRSR